jgi:hypothetical protein
MCGDNFRAANALRAGLPLPHTSKPEGRPITLAQAGIDKNLAKRARKGVEFL